jgi:hypothetical protein
LDEKSNDVKDLNDVAVYLQLKEEWGGLGFPDHLFEFFYRPFSIKSK